MKKANITHLWINALILVISFTFIVAMPPQSRARENDKLTIGLIPEMNVFIQKKRFEPLARYLEKRLNKSVKLSILSRYGNIVERFKEQGLDGAFLGSFTGALAIAQLGLEPLVRPVNEDGTSTYFGHIFVRKDSGIETVEDMKGKTFAFVEKATTAGYIFPLSYLGHKQIYDLDSHFKSYYFAGSHDATISSVLDGLADIGAAKNTIFDMVRKVNPRVDDELKILASSTRVPSNGLLVRPNLITPLKERIKEVLLTMNNSKDGIQALNALEFIRFVKTTRQDYSPVYQMASEAGIDLANYHYSNK